MNIDFVSCCCCCWCKHGCVRCRHSFVPTEIFAQSLPLCQIYHVHAWWTDTEIRSPEIRTSTENENRRRQLSQHAFRFKLWFMAMRSKTKHVCWCAVCPACVRVCVCATVRVYSKDFFNIIDTIIREHALVGFRWDNGAQCVPPNWM